MSAFILGGHPHLKERGIFARDVLPRLRTRRLNEVQGRLPGETPFTPMTPATRA